MRPITFPVLLVVLSGCAGLAVPPGLTIASYAVDGASYLGSGKSMTDHMLSDWTGRDCATWRIIKSRPICHDFTPEEIATRKRNKEEIRHDIGHAYIATNLDSLDLNNGTLAVAGSKSARHRGRSQEPASRQSPGMRRQSRRPSGNLLSCNPLLRRWRVKICRCNHRAHVKRGRQWRETAIWSSAVFAAAVRRCALPAGMRSCSPRYYRLGSVANGITGSWCGRAAAKRSPRRATRCAAKVSGEPIPCVFAAPALTRPIA